MTTYKPLSIKILIAVYGLSIVLRFNSLFHTEGFGQLFWNLGMLGFAAGCLHYLLKPSPLGYKVLLANLGIAMAASAYQMFESFWGNLFVLAANTGFLVMAMASDWYFVAPLKPNTTERETMPWEDEEEEEEAPPKPPADETKGNALLSASKSGYKELAKRVIDNGADVNFTNEKGQTAVHVASAEGKGSIVEMLVEHGAKLDVQDHEGNTPQQVAQQHEHAEVASWIGERLSAGTKELK